jgi:hypothetical protein
MAAAAAQRLLLLLRVLLVVQAVPCVHCDAGAYVCVCVCMLACSRTHWRAHQYTGMSKLELRNCCTLLLVVVVVMVSSTIC